MSYCITVKRELEDDYVYHQDFDHEPTSGEILESIMNEDINFDDRYGKFDYWRIN